MSCGKKIKPYPEPSSSSRMSIDRLQGSCDNDMLFFVGKAYGKRGKKESTWQDTLQASARKGTEQAAALLYGLRSIGHYYCTRRSCMDSPHLRSFLKVRNPCNICLPPLPDVSLFVKPEEEDDAKYARWRIERS